MSATQLSNVQIIQIFIQWIQSIYVSVEQFLIVSGRLRHSMLDLDCPPIYESITEYNACMKSITSATIYMKCSVYTLLLLQIGYFLLLLLNMKSIQQEKHFFFL